MEIKTDQRKKAKQRIFTLATITCILAETQRQTEKWESFTVENREASDVPLLEAVGLGSYGKVDKKGVTLCDWSEEHIWLSLLDLKLEAGTIIREAGSY